MTHSAWRGHSLAPGASILHSTALQGTVYVSLQVKHLWAMAAIVKNILLTYYNKSMYISPVMYLVCSIFHPIFSRNVPFVLLKCLHQIVQFIYQIMPMATESLCICFPLLYHFADNLILPYCGHSCGYPFGINLSSLHLQWQVLTHSWLWKWKSYCSKTLEFLDVVSPLHQHIGWWYPIWEEANVVYHVMCHVIWNWMHRNHRGYLCKPVKRSLYFENIFMWSHL